MFWGRKTPRNHDRKLHVPHAVGSRGIDLVGNRAVDLAGALDEAYSTSPKRYTRSYVRPSNSVNCGKFAPPYIQYGLGITICWGFKVVQGVFHPPLAHGYSCSMSQNNEPPRLHAFSDSISPETSPIRHTPTRLMPHAVDSRGIDLVGNRAVALPVAFHQACSTPSKRYPFPITLPNGEISHYPTYLTP